MDAPSRSTNNDEKGDAYADLKGCFMIFGGPVLYESKRRQKLTDREVNAAALSEAILAYLKWSETMITFDRKDHPDHILQLGCFLLVVDPIINNTRLSRILMDGGSSLNLLYAETYDSLGLSRVAIRPFKALFHGVIPGLQAVPLGRSTYP